MASQEDANLFVSDSAGTNSLSIPWPGDVVAREIRPSAAKTHVIHGDILTIGWQKKAKGGVIRLTGRNLRITAVDVAEK